MKIGPTPEEIAALSPVLQRVGLVARQAASNLAEAFSAAGRELGRVRIEQAEVRRVAQWRRKQEKDILRRQLECDALYFGRKRRWRRARGRRIETSQQPC